MLILCSCSGIHAGKYIIPGDIEGAKETFRENWRTYGAARSAIEPSLGRMRPPVYEAPWGTNLWFTIYPTTLRERALFAGPMFLPVIPIWFLEGASFTNDEKRAVEHNRIRITWRGNVEKARKIEVYLTRPGFRSAGLRDIARTSTEEIEFIYTFEENLAPQSTLQFKCSGSDDVLLIPLRAYRGLELVPYIKIL